MAGDVFETRAGGSAVAKGAILVFVAGMGLLCLLGALDRRGAAAEAAAVGAIGLATLALAWRLGLAFFAPAVRITDDTFTARRVLGRGVRWRFDGLKRFETTVERIETDGLGRRLPLPMRVETLHAVALDGSRRSVTLPDYAGRNARLLAELRRRSLLEVVADPVERVAPRWWQRPR